MSASISESTLEKFTTFGDLLRFLRRHAGVTQMELSIAVGYSDAQISRLEQNLRLPDIPTIEARFVSALGLEDEPRAVARLLELAANVRREDAPGLGLCPYKGMNYFDEGDADLFVGREALTAKLTQRILSLTQGGQPGETRCLAVVGASGSGKSSLVRAGLVPALRWNKKSSDWQIYILTPTAHPLESLAGSLTSDRGSVIATSTLMDDLARDPRSLQIFTKRQLPNHAHLLLVIDQFEELFALCRSEEERASFIGNLLTAASEADGPLSVLLTLRADFYAHCAGYIQLREALAQNQEYIGTMAEDELRRAIEEPARRGRWEFEPGLVDVLLHDVGREPGALPLLSHALYETWQRRRGRMMTLGGYASSGGVRGAIAETAEAVFSDRFTNQQRSIARRIFLRLTELSDEASTADTRRRATFNELILKPEEAPTTHVVLKALADARLIITSEDSAEVAHEALIREWPTLQGWLEENREGLRLHRQLTDAAQEWQQLDHTADLLYRGARLAQAREWTASHKDEMNTLEHEFLAASIDASEREAAEREAQRQRELKAAQKLAEAEKQRAEIESQRAEEQVRNAGQLRKRAVYLAGAFAVALIMALTALFFGSQARQAAVAAQENEHLAFSRELAAASISNLEVDPQRSILLALEALDVSYTTEAEDALHRAVQASRVRMVLQAHTPGAEMGVVFSPDQTRILSFSRDEFVKVWDAATGNLLFSVYGHCAAYSPDGSRIASVTGGGIVKMWDAETGEEIPIPNAIDGDLCVGFSPDGRRLATASETGTLPKIWDATTGEELVSFSTVTSYVSFIYFSPDGRRVLTVSDDRNAHVWDASTGEQLLILPDQQGFVIFGAFSPDGKRIATIAGPNTNTVFVWDAQTGEKLFTFSGHAASILAVQYSPDGAWLATSSIDRKVKIWDANTGRELFTLAGHTSDVVGIDFKSDGSALVTGSVDGTIRLWDLTASHELFTFSTPNYSSGQLAFTTDGTRLVTSGENGEVQIRDARSGNVLQSLKTHESLIRDVAFSPDSGKVFIAGEDLGIWDAAGGSLLDTISSHTSVVNGVAVNGDGTRLATGSDDYKVMVWDISKMPPELVLSEEAPGQVRSSLAFSPECVSPPEASAERCGARLAAGIVSGIAIVWDAATGEEVLILRGHMDAVLGVTFSPDGKQIATASYDGTAKIWDAGSGQVLFTLRGHTNAVTSVAFSPDGKQIATASWDGIARLWDAATGEELITFLGDGSALNEVAFSSDGTRLATGGELSVRVYLLRVNDLIALAKTRVTRELTGEECQRYLHLEQTACALAVAQATTTPIPSTDQGRVCQVTDTDGLYDNFFNEMVYEGLQDAHEIFGWDTQVLQTTASPDFDRNIGEFLRGDCDLIVGLFQMAVNIYTAAEANPAQKFLLPDVDYQPLENLRMQLYATDQAAFLAGYIAASVTQTGKVGVFGGVGIPPVTDFMDGFALGVEYYNEKNGTQVEVIGWDVQKHEGLFLGDFCCELEGREITQQLLDEGADIVLPVAGPIVMIGTGQAIQSNGNAYMIGVDSDWALSNPADAQIVLTSIVKNLDVTVVQAVQAIEDGTFTGGIHIGTLETGEVGLAPFHDLDSLVSPQVRADLDQITADIIAGKIKTKP